MPTDWLLRYNEQIELVGGPRDGTNATVRVDVKTYLIPCGDEATSLEYRRRDGTNLFDFVRYYSGVLA